MPRRDATPVAPAAPQGPPKIMDASRAAATAAGIQILTPVAAIRAKCMDCGGGMYKEVSLCPVVACPIWPYRMGKRPKAADITRWLKEIEADKIASVTEAGEDGGDE